MGAAGLAPVGAPNIMQSAQGFKPEMSQSDSEHPTKSHGATPEDLFKRFDVLGIETVTHRHPPLFTVEESRRLRGAIAGSHCKSLFLKDRKSGLWLVMVAEDHAVDLNALARTLAAPRFSFADAALMDAALGVAPGSVTPFALINDRTHRVKVVLDKTMLAAPLVNFHPLINTATTTIASRDLLAFIAALGHHGAIVEVPRRQVGPGA